MFICVVCHPKTECKWGTIERLMASYGPCEMCGDQDYCLDCKDY